MDKLFEQNSNKGASVLIHSYTYYYILALFILFFFLLIAEYNNS